MEKYFKRKSATELSSTPTKRVSSSKNRTTNRLSTDPLPTDHFSTNHLPTDPGLRPRISEYNPNDQDEIRRFYLQKGACQPRNHEFPQTLFGKGNRRFNPDWFDEHPYWLEYSIEKDSLFCLCCYLFKEHIGDQAGGDVFVVKGFSNWKKKEKLRKHVGGPNSAHNNAMTMCRNLMSQKQQIRTFFPQQSDKARNEYRIRLTATIDCLRYCVRQGLAFRGNDESYDSSNQGNFLELLKFLADHNDDIKAFVLEKAPENNKLTSPDIQQDIINAFASEIINHIIKDIGDSFFSIMVDESRDVSTKEQMAIALRYVDKKGHVIERILSFEQVSETTALSLKVTIENFFSRNGLSLSMLRGQCYDGASNMRGEFNGLKTLILKENECAYYVHCFAHQLQSALVSMAKNRSGISMFFNLVTHLVNVVGASCKRCDMLQGKQASKVSEALEGGELLTGQVLNQETSLVRSSDTRWGSHYNTLLHLRIMFPAVIDVLEAIEVDGSINEQRGEARMLLGLAQQFEFIFILHLMIATLEITNELSQALQRKDQDIVNAMTLVKVSKNRLQEMRENGWDSLFDEVSSFCKRNSIVIPILDDIFSLSGRPRHGAQEHTNLHHYRVELFYSVIDVQLLELNSRFTEANIELLLSVACLRPDDSFSAFNKQQLIRLATLYPTDFSAFDLAVLDNQLENYIVDMRSSSDFSQLKGIGALAQKMVETKRNIVYPLVYLILRLTLTLPIATATVERTFSAMKIVKSRLCNRMSDQLMNDSLIGYIEKDILDGIDNEVIIQHFQKMKTPRGQL